MDGFSGGGGMSLEILVPIDDSPLSRRALRHALQDFPNASVTVLHVVDLFEPAYGAYPDFETSYEPLMGSEEWYDRAEEVSGQLIEEAREIASECERDVSTTSEIGDPTRIIVDYANEEEIDHIVLGAHGRMEEERPVFGSVAEIVARRAMVPVTLIR
jgi:nucleotide-binding universal stress UspA family protein